MIYDNGEYVYITGWVPKDEMLKLLAEIKDCSDELQYQIIKSFIDSYPVTVIKKDEYLLLKGRKNDV